MEVSRTGPDAFGLFEWSVTYVGGDSSTVTQIPTANSAGLTGGSAVVTEVDSGFGSALGGTFQLKYGAMGALSGDVSVSATSGAMDVVVTALDGASGAAVTVTRLGPSLGNAYVVVRCR